MTPYFKNDIYKENQLFSVPKGTLKLESPEKLDSFGDSLFTCYAFAKDMPLPSDLKLKLTSHQTDHLAELSSSDAVELQLGKISTTKLRHLLVEKRIILSLWLTLTSVYNLNRQKLFFYPQCLKIL